MPTEARYVMGIYRCLSVVFRLGVTALVVQLTLACAATEGSGSRQAAEEVAVAQAAAEAARSVAMQVRSGHEPQYLLLKAEETQLAGAHDAGRVTYLEFSAPVAGPLELFDHQGRALTAAIATRVVAVEGVHEGILVRRAERSSYISPNPRALSLPQRPVPGSSEYLEARAKLENQAGQLQAMQRALAAASRPAGPDGVAARHAASPAAAFQGSSTSPASSAFLAAVPPGPWLVRPPSTLPLNALSRSPYLPEEGRGPLVRPVPSSQASLRNDRLPLPAVPLAVANATAAAPERGLVRVFFATASRAIVAPDDGLGLLLRETANADQIRVTGYTDSIGSRATNDALALARAEAVVQILLRRGVPPTRIFSNAVGADDFIADNASDRGRALNRRVEVLLMKNGAPLDFDASARASR